MKLDIRNPLAFVLAMLMALALAACATNMQKPVTPQDYVQSTKGQVTAAYKSIGDLKAQGSITSAEGLGYLASVDRIAKDVQSAQTLAEGGADMTSVQGALKTSLAGLVLLQAELNAKQKGK